MPDVRAWYSASGASPVSFRDAETHAVYRTASTPEARRLLVAPTGPHVPDPNPAAPVFGTVYPYWYALP